MGNSKSESRSRVLGGACLLALSLTTGCSGLFSRQVSALPPAPTAVARVIETTGAGQALSRITTDPIDESYPRLSPNGRTLLFQSQSYSEAVVDNWGREVTPAAWHYAIAAVDPSTGGRRTLYTSSASRSFQPDWLADGSSFVYVTDAVGTEAIVRALSNSPNSGIAIVASSQVAPRPRTPAVSPAGNRVALVLQMNGQDQVAAIDLNGANLTIFGPGQSPAWDPTGQTLAFIRRIGSYQQLMTVSGIDGTGLVQLTNHDDHSWQPAWSPDGRFIVFIRSQGAVANLFAIAPDGTTTIQLTQGNCETRTPHWGRDGFIYFSSDAFESLDLWRFRPVGELALQITPQAPSAPVLGPSVPDGQSTTVVPAAASSSGWIN